MERLAHAEELLERSLDDLDAVVGNLRDLARFNRVFGLRLSRAAIDHLVPSPEPLRLIDVGTGGADIPIALLADARRAGRKMCVAAVDQSPEILQAARLARPEIRRIADLHLELGEATLLPALDNTYDVAHSSLLAHHLEPPQVVEMLGEMARVATRGIVVNDLVRSRLNWAGAWVISHTLTRNRLFRVDAPMSVQRAYTRRELRALFDDAGLRIVGEFGGFFGHRVAIAAVRR